MAERVLSHYRVIEEISRGGMGIVYRALDTKLDREVALKVLPPELVSDPERKRRFVLEAKAAAALQHPHISTIYEIDEAEGTTFIVMELIQGEKLSEALRRDRLSLGRSLELSAETAEGLARAHEKGIVHRDLKPANLMLTDGHIKIIDFGLAKLIEPVRPADSDQDTALRGTEPGKMLGTVAYMSPEQACGRSLDHRSDVFSLGTVLFEMITGRLPFEGPSAVETLNAIVKEPAPPLSAAGWERDSRPLLEAQRIVHRCLAKDPGDRYQTMKDLLSELRRVRRESDSGVSAAAVALRALRARRRWLVSGAVAVAALAAVVYLARPRDEGVPKLTNPVQLTSALGAEQYATWSPDGGRIAYQGIDVAGNLDVWVTQSRGGQPVNWTADHEGVDRYPSWSPDGSQIAFTSQREGWGYFVMSALGGKARKALPASDSAGRPAWSADGSRLAGVGRDPGGSFFIEIVSLTSRESQRVPIETPALGALDLSWSPDGRHFAYVDATGPSEISRLRVLRVSDRKAFDVTDGMSQDRSPSWSADGRRLFFVSNRKGSMDLWQQRIRQDGAPDGEPERITTGLGMRSAVFSRDGSKLVYSRGRGFAANVWRAPILAGRPATWSDAHQLTFDDAWVEFLDVSPDGQRLAVSSDRSGNQDLWTLPAMGGEMQPLTDHPTPDWAPSWSPDGKEIAFYAYRSGNRDVWVMALDGRPPRQHTRAATQDYSPAWSPDGKHIALGSILGGNEAVWVLPADGGEPKRLGEPEPGFRLPTWSPDGKWIAFLSDRSGGRRLWRMPAEGGEAEQLTKGPASGRPRWSRDGKEIYFLAGGERGSNLWALSLADRSERPLTDFTGRPGYAGTFALATDGKYLYFTWEETVGDLWVMDVAWE